MFYGYPITAVSENWLHDCLCEILETVHSTLNAGWYPPLWPDIIPESYRSKLESRTGIESRLDEYISKVSQLDTSARQQVLNCLLQQNDIPNLVSCSCECERLRDLPAVMHDPIIDLFVFAFELLTPLGIRDQHYQIIYNAREDKICPFCGCEYFDAPGAPREDYDHYLLKKDYPFAAANLFNLVPMGSKCNSRYKLVADVLRNDLGQRRKSFFPYGDLQLSIVLTKSTPFEGSDNKNPKWVIEFVPDSPESTTWDNIFHIRERFERDVLNPSFSRWLKEYGTWFVKRKGRDNLDDNYISTSVLEFAADAALTGFTAREFLKVPVFQMLHSHCESGHERLLNFMRDVINNAAPCPS